MSKTIMAGCDLHDKTIVLSIACERQQAGHFTFANTSAGRRKMQETLHKMAKETGSKRIVLVYEASSLGFGLHDELRQNDIEAYVLAPTRIARSTSDQRNKSDQRDADQLLDIVRSHVLAGTKLHSVWIPSKELRDDRELVRARLELVTKTTRVKAQIKSLLKRNSLQSPTPGKCWSKVYRAWLRGLSDDSRQPNGMRVVLGSQLRGLESLEAEIKTLEEAVGALAQSARYQSAVESLCIDQGVGLLTAMVFLTELGDPKRFTNRRQVAAYFGLTPTSHESGERSDRKGHITRHGSGRVRRMLCQATWTRFRFDPEEKERYETAKASKHKKIAVVAGMRRLAIRMWHHACDVGEGTTAERLANCRAKRLGSGSTEEGPPLPASGRLGPQAAARSSTRVRGDGEGGRGSRKPRQRKTAG
jgi:transposase